MLEKYVRENHLPVVITSGGVQAHERAPNMLHYSDQMPQFVQALQRLGLDFITPKIERHQAHNFSGKELKQADLILTMTSRQRDYLSKYANPNAQVLMLSQLADLAREIDVFDAMEAPVSSFEAFVYEIAQLQYYLDFQAFRFRLGLP